MVRKKICIILVALMSMSILFGTTAFAAESNIPDATSQFYVNDFANIISDEVEREMQERAVAYADSTDGIQIVVTTVKTIGNADPEKYTTDMYNKYAIGKNSMGVLIMLSVETRDIQIRLGTNMAKYISASRTGDIIDAHIEELAANDFETALAGMQKTTIEYISKKVNTATNEVAVSQTTVEDVKKDSGALWGVLAALGITGGGGVSIFGLSKLFKKRKEKKAAEEIARIENSDIVKAKNERILSLQQELENQRNQAKRDISSKDSDISYLKSSLKDVREELKQMKERKERAIIAYPDIEEKIDAIFAQEKNDADKAAAAKVESVLQSALAYESTRHNLNIFQAACDALRSLSYDEEKYVSADLISSVRNAYQKSFDLQQKHEEEQRVRRNKEKAASVQNIILAALALSVSRFSLSELKNACNAYENLTNEQQNYITADVQALYDMKRRAKRLQDQYDEEERRKEEERRRRQREEEEARRRRMNSYSSSTRSSYSGSSFRSHGGMGGSSRGHGAGRKF